MEGMEDEEDLLAVQRAKHAAFYLHQHLLAKAATNPATVYTKQSKCVQTDPIPLPGDEGAAGSSSSAGNKTQEEGALSHPKKWLTIFQETPAFSALSDLVNHLSTRNLDKYHFKYRRNRDGAVEQLEVTLENAVITVSSFSDIPTRLLFSKKGKLTVLTLFRDPFQTDYVDLISGEIYDTVVENAFLMLDNEQLFCPGVPKDIASKPNIAKKVQKYRFPFERYQSRGCPVWFDPPEDEIFAQDILIRKGIHPCEKCFKLYSLASNDAESDEESNQAPPPPQPSRKTAAKSESGRKAKASETSGTKRKYTKKKVEPSPTMVPRAENFPAKAAEAEDIVESEDDMDLDLDIGQASDSDGSDYCPSPKPTPAKKRGRPKSTETKASAAKATDDKSEESSESDSGNDGNDNAEESSGSSSSDEETAPKTKRRGPNKKKGEAKEKFRLREVFRCEDCDKNFSSEKPWKSHRLNEHADERPYKCDLNCAFNCAEKSELIGHYTAGHNSEQTHKCRFCYRQYYKPGELYAHTRHHKGEKPVKCQQCPKILSNETCLKEHVKYTHSGHPREKRFICEVCSQGFAQKIYLTIHQRKHTGERPFKCEECDKTFTSKLARNRHAVIHTDVKSHLCTLCGKAFVRSTNLAAHTRIHQGLRNHKCEHCGKCFYAGKDLVQHVRTHTGEKPFVCEHCGKGFAQKYNLTVHSRTHNPDRVVRKKSADLVEKGVMTPTMAKKTRKNLPPTTAVPQDAAAAFVECSDVNYFHFGYPAPTMVMPGTSYYTQL